ncbi:MAG TPA: tetratricopeptide repeat protein, partial [Candidatus Bathyarchaeia archaeon]|nr:tetratricopeptide repeat protein [Candidatus Bathyarchaeia archaeon]
MKPGFLALVLVALMSPAFPLPAFAQGGNLKEMAQPTNGTITVYVRNELGEPISVYPQIKLTVTGTGVTRPSIAQSTGDGWVFSNLEVAQEYQVEVKADGYQTAYETTSLPYLDHASSNLIVFLKPLGQHNEFRKPTGQFVLAPRAEKEVEHGLKDLRSQKFESAQKHVERALQMAPGNPYVNYVMGMIYLVSKQPARAKPFLEESVSIDPKQPPSLLALGTVRLQLNDNAGAIEILERDVLLDATSWKAEWSLANAYLRQRNYSKAREYAERALQNGKQYAAQAELLLGQALAGLGERDKAIETMESYLTAHPQDPNAAKIRTYVETLRHPPSPVVVPVGTGSGTASAETSAGTLSETLAAPLTAPAPAPPVDLPPKENWAPPDIDAAKPFVISGAACSLPKILHAATKNADQFVTTLQQFSAIEEYQSVEIKHDAHLESPDLRKFSYVVTMGSPRPRVIEIHEIRDQGLAPVDLPGELKDEGAPARVLVFHPVYQDDFEWTCEGLGEWNSKPAWVVHFQQRADRPTSLLAAYETPSQEYALPLKGRAWISQNGGQVMHLETDLTHPLPELGLLRQHFAIDYQPVSFQTHKVELW